MGLRVVGEDEEGLGVLAEKALDHRALVGAPQAGRSHARIDDMKGAFRAAGGPDHRVFGQRVLRRLAPTMPGKGCMDAIVVQARPEEFFERFQPFQALQDFQDIFLVFERGTHRRGSPFLRSLPCPGISQDKKERLVGAPGVVSEAEWLRRPF